MWFKGMTMRYIIYGNPITKKNSLQIVYAGGHPRISQSKQYKAYRECALWQLVGQRLKQPIDEPVNIMCLYYMKTRRMPDLVNLLEGTLDILVDAGILKDDNANIVVGHDGSRVRYDKQNPRVEIAIEAEREG